MEQETGNTEADHPLDLKCNIDVTTEEPEFGSHDSESGSKPSESKGETKVEPDELKDEPAEANSSPRRASPEPSCAICLGQLENKSFTDNCFHPFCFNCLVEWSKVKAECPLCKQRFKSIVYNVRSNEDYDLYTVTRSSAESSWQSDDGSRRFRYSSTLTSERIWERRFLASFDVQNRQQEFQIQRLMYAPHTVSYMSAVSLNNHRTVATGLRRTVYEEGLWVQPLSPLTKVRDTSPHFYHQNPACTHRLIPWLNRELLTLLQNSETRVMFVLDLIMALIMRFEIRSEEFHTRLEPYLGDRTSHFVHEFYHFASSIYDMEEYDQHITYERLETYDTTVVLSSPGSDVIYLPNEDDSSAAGPSSGPSTSASTSRGQTSQMSSLGVKKLFLRRNQENDCWNVFPQGSSTAPCPSNFRPSSFVAMPGMSDFITPNDYISCQTTDLEIDDIVSDGDDDNDECVIVDELKPRWQRTPEVIDIAESSDDDCRTVQTPKAPSPGPSSEAMHFAESVDLFIRAIQMNEQSGVGTSSTRADLVQELTDMANLAASSSSSRAKKERSSTRDGGGDASSRHRHADDGDRLRKKKYRKHSSSKDKGKKARHHSSRPGDASEAVECSSSSRSCSRDQQVPPPAVLSDSATRSGSIPGNSPVKRSYYSDSTDVSDHPGESSEHRRKRSKHQSKLRSVVAQVSGDLQHSRSDSSHSKKHKDKHKKKKKHHKHSRSKDSDKD